MANENQWAAPELTGREVPDNWDDYQLRLYEQQEDQELAWFEKRADAIEKLQSWAATNDSKFGLKVEVGTSGVVTWGPETTVIDRQEFARVVFWDPKLEMSRTAMFSGSLASWAEQNLRVGSAFEITCGLERSPEAGKAAWDIWAEGAKGRGAYRRGFEREGLPSPLTGPPPSDAKLVAGFTGPNRNAPRGVGDYQSWESPDLFPGSFESAIRERVGRCHVADWRSATARLSFATIPWALRELGVCAGYDAKLPSSLGRGVLRWCSENRIPARFAPSPLGLGVGRRGVVVPVKVEGRVLWTPHIEKTAKGEPYVRVYVGTEQRLTVTAVFWGDDIAKLPRLDGTSKVRLEGEPSTPQTDGPSASLELQRPRLEVMGRESERPPADLGRQLVRRPNDGLGR